MSYPNDIVVDGVPTTAAAGPNDTSDARALDKLSKLVAQLISKVDNLEKKKINEHVDTGNDNDGK